MDGDILDYDKFVIRILQSWLLSVKWASWDSIVFDMNVEEQIEHIVIICLMNLKNFNSGLKNFNSDYKLNIQIYNYIFAT